MSLGAAEGENVWLTLEQLSVFLDNCERTLGAGWHVEAMLELELAHHGPLGAAAGSAATLGDALNVVAHFIELRAPYAWLSVQRSSSTLTLSFIQTHSLHRHRSMLVETAMLSMIRLIEKIRGRVDCGLRLEFDTAVPPYAEHFRNVVPAQVRFACEKTTLVVPAAWLSDANLMADSALHEVALQACRSLLEQLAGRSPLESQLRARLLSTEGVKPSLAALAQELNISPRSLIRKLKQKGTSYQSIVDDIHQNVAQHQLRHSSLSVAQIGYNLGYADPSNFGRAFRAWSGMSPGEYRRQADQ